MKIAISFGFFLPVPPERGGATEKIWSALARRLVARGHEVVVFSRTWPGWPDREIRDGVTYVRLPGWDHRRKLWQNLILDFRWSLRVRRELPPDALVIAHNISLPILLRLPGWRHPSPVSVVLGRMPKGQLHAYGGVDRVYATSHAVAERARQENPALGPRLHVLANGIDWPSFQGPSERAATGPLRIGFVGRLHPEKGLDFLVEACGLLAREPGLPPWELCLMGPVRTAEGGGGEAYIERLQTRIQSLQLGDRVRLLPPTWDSDALTAFYRSLDLFAYPSLAEQGETFGVSVAESMAAGAAPVVSALACFRDLVTPGRNGLVFDHRADDASAQLAARFAELLSDSALRTSLAGHARADAQRFDYDRVADALDADLRTLFTSGQQTRR